MYSDQKRLIQKQFDEQDWSSQLRRLVKFYPPLKPQRGEVILQHHRMFDSFHGTDLHDQLRAHSIEKVIFAGLIEDSGEGER